MKGNSNNVKTHFIIIITTNYFRIQDDIYQYLFYLDLHQAASFTFPIKMIKEYTFSKFKRSLFYLQLEMVIIENWLKKENY